MKIISVKKCITLAPVYLSVCLLSTQVQATEYQIDIQNLTRGIYLTPLVVAAHSESGSLFSSGMAASSSLQMMAEGGDISGLVADLTALSATISENPAAGLLAPGAATTTTLNTDAMMDNMYLSIAAM